MGYPAESNHEVLAIQPRGVRRHTSTASLVRWRAEVWITDAVGMMQHASAMRQLAAWPTLTVPVTRTPPGCARVARGYARRTRGDLVGQDDGLHKDATTIPTRVGEGCGGRRGGGLRGRL